MSLTVTINGNEIPIEYPTNTKGISHLEFILKTPKVDDWFADISPEIVVSKVTILTDVTFGKNMLFLLMNVTCTDRRSGKSLAGIVFLRGNAVTCLILIREKETGKLYFAKVKQPRVAGRKWLWELCAGMFEVKEDGTGKMCESQMTTEIREELGIEVVTTGVKTADPTQQFNYMEKLGEYDPSPGATGETIITYWYMVEMTTEEITALHGKNIANDAGNCTEIIQVGIEEFNMRNIIAMNDSKAMCTTLQLASLYNGFVPY